MIYKEGDEVSPKHVKKSKKKPPKKSKHKHEYEDIYLKCKSSDKFNNPNDDKYWITIAKRCKICGKIYTMRLFNSRDNQEYIKSLPRYETDADIFDVKYV